MMNLGNKINLKVKNIVNIKGFIGQDQKLKREN